MNLRNLKREEVTTKDDKIAKELARFSEKYNMKDVILMYTLEGDHNRFLTNKNLAEGINNFLNKKLMLTSALICWILGEAKHNEKIVELQHCIEDLREGVMNGITEEIDKQS